MVIDVYLVSPKLLSEIDSRNSRLLVLGYSVVLLTMMMLGRHHFQESKNSSCFICHVYGDKKDIFHDKEHPKYYGLNEMKMHLLTQPVIVVRCLSQFFTFAACLYPCSLVKWLLVLLLLPLWFPIYLLCITIVLLYSSSLSTLCYTLGSQHFDGCKRFWLRLLEMNLIIFGYFILALEIASDSVTIISGCLMRLPNYLPFASLGLVTIFSFGRFTLRTPKITMILHLNFMSITLLKRKNEVFTNYRRVTFRVLEERTTILHLTCAVHLVEVGCVFVSSTRYAVLNALITYLSWKPTNK